MGNIDISEVYTLFEEIKELIKKGSNKAPVIQPEIELPDLSVINDLTDKLNEVIEESRKPVIKEHHYIFSIASKKVLTAMIIISAAFLFSLFGIYSQWKEKTIYKNNDLKYRYIKIVGNITANDISRLENLFENNRDSIKIIRKQVNQCEEALREDAKRLEKARLKELEAERLRREAEELKQR